MDENSKTLAVYEENFKEYAKSVNKEARNYDWIYSGLDGVPKSASIFEIGSGMGIEAERIEDLGYRIQRSDAALSFREYMRSNGHDALEFNIQTDNFSDDYDVIIASAVLLHFNRDDFRKIIKKIYDGLRPDGRFLFSVQKGEGEQWKENKGGPRFFCYWTEEKLNTELYNAGFVIDGIDSFSDNKWLGVNAEKKHES